MQQRSSTSSSFRATTDDHCSIIFSPAQEPQGRCSPETRSMDDSSGSILPVSDPSCRKRDHNSRYKFSERWIHLIPLILLLVLFILWWSSYPGKFLQEFQESVSDGNFFDRIFSFSSQFVSVSCICDLVHLSERMI